MDWTKIPHTKNLLSKQCEIANVDFNDVDWDSCDWYEKITWTTKNEKSFKNWVIDYLKHNKCARKELFTISSLKSKKHLEKWFDKWNFMYGFRIKND